MVDTRCPTGRMQGTDVNGRKVVFGSELGPLADLMYREARPLEQPRGAGATDPGRTRYACPYCGHDFVLPKPDGKGWNCPSCNAENA